MSSSMDMVVYKPLVTSASCDLEDPDGYAYDEHEAECELKARLFSSCSQPYNHQSKKYHHSSISSNILAYFGPRQLRILLYLVSILLFLVFIAQLSTNERSAKSLPTTASHILLYHHDSSDGTSSSPNQNDPMLSPPPSLSLSSSSSLSSPQTSQSTKQATVDNRDRKSIEKIMVASEEQANSSSSTDTDTKKNTYDSRRYQPIHDSRPQYDSYLSSVINERNSQKQINSDEPFDDLHFPINDEQLHIHRSAKSNQYTSPIAYSSSSSSSSPYLQANSTTIAAAWWKLDTRDKDRYVTVTNYIRAMKSFNYNESITLTTQATTEFIYHTLELCKRWDGPISVAVFTPGPELLIATTLIKFMRQCLPVPLSACIRDKVTWHLVYNRQYGPEPSAIKYPRFHLDLENYPLFAEQDQCHKLVGPEPSDSIRQFEEDLKRNNKMVPFNYRQQYKIPYPINVLRNTARLAANTKYVLASDIELYPSINLVPSFSNLLANHHLLNEYGNSSITIKKFVFTLPVFEVKLNVSAPKTKKELVKLVNRGDAIFFHKWVCDECQNFPNRLLWLQTDKIVDYQTNPGELVVFEVTQRDKTKNSWEPIFIGTNEDPLYDDRLTWDGRRDKMAQMYEMCLQDYQLMVLGNAFLVHAPGIKHIDKNDNMKRLKYMRENNAIYEETMSRLRQHYSTSSNVNKC